MPTKSRVGATLTLYVAFCLACYLTGGAIGLWITGERLLASMIMAAILSGAAVGITLERLTANHP